MIRDSGLLFGPPCMPWICRHCLIPWILHCRLCRYVYEWCEWCWRCRSPLRFLKMLPVCMFYVTTCGWQTT